MKKITLILAFSFIASISTAQEKEMATPTPNYRQAAKYSPKNLGKLVHSTTVRPNWLENGNRFGINTRPPKVPVII